MKKLPLLIVIPALAVGVGACHHRNRPIWPETGPFARTRTIVISTNDSYEKISLQGHLRFNNDSTAIASLTPGGIIKYTKNDQRVLVEAGKDGALSYEVYDDGEKLAPGPRSNEIVTEAVKEMARRGLDGRR